jgi:hypothetical protein
MQALFVSTNALLILASNAARVRIVFLLELCILILTKLFMQTLYEQLLLCDLRDIEVLLSCYFVVPSRERLVICLSLVTLLLDAGLLLL